LPHVSSFLLAPFFSMSANAPLAQRSYQDSEQKRGNSMTNEALSVEVPTGLYLDLAYQLRQTGDTRHPDDVVILALKAWLGTGKTRSAGGYQWKELFLPDGTELRMRYRGVYYYAKIVRDQLDYAGESVSPRDWGLMVTGTVRNAWRDIWIRRGTNECWTRAAMWRTDSPYSPRLPGTDRRRQARRVTD
jgi:hypothetical protein